MVTNFNLSSFARQAGHGLVSCAPFLAMLVLLLFINKIFLHLITKPLNRRKFMGKLFQELLVYQLVEELLNDWRTRRNTIKNSEKVIPMGQPLVKRKRQKSVKFIQENTVITFNEDDAPVSLRLILDQP